MKLADLLDTDALYDMLDQGYVRFTKDEETGLRTYCYTDKTVLEENWNAVTRRCRGLVVDPEQQIIAYCMPKFHNAAEHINGKPYTAPLPHEPFKIYAKADGSLGTVFHYAGRWRVTTKSGFNSEQAKWAQRWLDDQCLDGLPTHNTYVTEIIYPQNRIVVNYGPETTLKLLTVFGPDGQEHDVSLYGAVWELMGGSVIQRFPDAKLSAILFRSQRNQRVDGTPVTGTQAEGYVLRFNSGLRVKVKFADYVRLHGVITGLTERHVWELLRDGRDLADLMALLPDEYCEWLLATADRLRKDFQSRAWRLLRDLRRTGLPDDPRDFRAYSQLDDGSGSLRALYDVLSAQTWDSLRPAAVGPWKGDQ